MAGRFRGRNLYGDLPDPQPAGRAAPGSSRTTCTRCGSRARSRRARAGPARRGLKRDTGKWIEVVGRATTVGGVTYLRALDVKLSGRPSPTAQAAPPAAAGAAQGGAVVVFALPVGGDAEVARNSRFVVQFSKDMDEATFAGHVVLRYSGPVLPGDRPFAGTRLSYDPGRRALTVDPGDVLRPGPRDRADPVARHRRHRRPPADRAQRARGRKRRRGRPALPRRHLTGLPHHDDLGIQELRRRAVPSRCGSGRPPRSPAGRPAGRGRAGAFGRCSGVVEEPLVVRGREREPLGGASVRIAPGASVKRSAGPSRASVGTIRMVRPGGAVGA